MLWLIAISVIVLLIYVWFKQRFSYWEKYDFPYIPAKVPFGSTSTLGFKEHTTDFFSRYYEKYKNVAPAYALHFAVIPAIVPTDPELIKEILVTSFDSFHDRGLPVNEDADPLSGHLFMKKGQEWKDLRAKLSPTFTSGKIKMMFPIVSSTADRMIEYLRPYAEREEPLEMKEIFSSFTTEVIANVAFGLEIQCLGNPENEFRKMAREVFEPPTMEMIKGLLFLSFENLSKLLKISFTSQKTIDFFMGTVRDTLNYREQNNVHRNDFFQLLMNIKNSEQGMSFNELAANSFVFFLAGFETSSSVSTFAAYELALNQDIQDKLRGEVLETLAKHNGEVTYDAIMEMKYLDMVFNETLRKYPVVDVQFRKCVKDFPIPNSKLVIPANTLILLHSASLHNDERFFENPSKFDPERFNEENVKKITPYTYIPFSEGPRICIGLRFGTMQTKLGLVKLLKNYKILPCSKTIIPMRFTPNASFQSPVGGMWLKLEKLKE